MNNLETIDLLELINRYNYLVEAYVPLAKEVASKLEKFGKYRQELQVISAEFVRRGYNAQEPESLKKMVEAELEKRNVISQTDTNQRNTESRENSK